MGIKSSLKNRLLIQPRKFQPPLPIPDGYDRRSLLDTLSSINIDGSTQGELTGYVQADFERFIYTLSLIPPKAEGRILEIGANPYFTTLLVRKFRPSLNMSLVNYFGGDTHQASQQVAFPGFDGTPEEIELPYYNANLEMSELPFETASFDIILFCEVLEHLTLDPLHAMLELKRVLKPGGRLVLTTPNAARLENVAAFIEGRNIYDVYSKYGAYGRHNREYTRHELAMLLRHCGLTIETFFTANVHDDIPPSAKNARAINRVIREIENREHDLGQYLFTSSINDSPSEKRRPTWLFRSYPPSDMV